MKKFNSTIYVLILSAIIFLSSGIHEQAYAQAGGSPTSGGGGGCKGDCINPTLGVDNRGFQYVEDGFTINNISYDVEHYYQVIPTQAFNINEQIKIVLLVYENRGAENIQHVELSIATYDKIISGVLTEDSISTILWDKDDGVELEDKTELLDNVAVTAEPIDDTVTRVTISFQITAPLEPSTIKVKMWDSQLNGWNNYFENAIQVAEQPTDNAAQIPLAQDGVESHAVMPELVPQESHDDFIEGLAAIESERSTALNLQALEYVKNNEFAKAIEIYESLLQENPNDASVLNDLGRVYSLMWNDETAIKYYEQAILIDPENALYRTNLAISLFNIGEYDQSLTQINKSLEISPDYEIAMGMKALIWTVVGEYETAKPIVDQTLRINPLNVDALTSKAIIAYEGGDLEAAKDYLDVILDIDPAFYYVLLLHAQVSAELEQYDDVISSFYAARSYEALAANNPTGSGVQVKYFESNNLDELRLLVAKAHHSIGDETNALNIVNDVLKNDPDNFKASLLEDKINPPVVSLEQQVLINIAVLVLIFVGIVMFLLLKYSNLIKMESKQNSTIQGV